MDDLASNKSLPEMDDRALVRAVARGRQQAMAELYARYASMLLGLARRIVGNTEDAEEVLQEALLHAWDQASRYDPSRSSVSTWLVMITRSRAIDRLRNRRVVDRAVTTAGKESGDGHESARGVAAVLHGERRQRIQVELGRIPEEQREILELAFFEGMTQREIAESTGIPLGTVKTRSLLAMKKLRAALRDEIRELL